MSPKRGDLSEDDVPANLPKFDCQITSNIMKTHHVLFKGKEDKLEEEMSSTITIGRRLKKKSTGVLHSGTISSNSVHRREPVVDIMELSKNLRPESFAIFPH